MNLKEKLIQDLSQYGLNPQDWKILGDRDGPQLIINKHDKDLCLIGRPEKTGPFIQWQSIEYIAI